MEQNMICNTNAKLNFGLNIISKRNDGYHNLESIFFPIQIYDKLEISLNSISKNDELFVSGIELDCQADSNLVMKALRLMRQKYNIPALKINLQKSIPIGAGLAGGSGNGSFMLKMLNKYFNLNIKDVDLIQMATKLGADCPFFIKNNPAFVQGIGEIFEDINLNLEGYYLVIINPNIFVSTKEAFSEIKPTLPLYSLKEIIKKPIEEWKQFMCNDFEQSVFLKYPQIQELKEYFYQNGALYSQMSGTGSSVFGIFKQQIEDLDQFKNGISKKGGYLIWQIKL